MYGLAGARATPGMPQLDAFDARARDAEREARKAKRNNGKAKAHVRTKAQRRDKGHLTNG